MNLTSHFEGFLFSMPLISSLRRICGHLPFIIIYIVNINFIYKAELKASVFDRAKDDLTCSLSEYT